METGQIKRSNKIKSILNKIKYRDSLHPNKGFVSQLQKTLAELEQTAELAWEVTLATTTEKWKSWDQKWKQKAKSNKTKWIWIYDRKKMQWNGINCDILQYTVIYCNNTAIYCDILQYTAIYCNKLQYTAIYCDMLQYTAINCHIMRYKATILQIIEPYKSIFLDIFAPQSFFQLL